MPSYSCLKPGQSFQLVTNGTVYMRTRDGFRMAQGRAELPHLLPGVPVIPL